MKPVADDADDSSSRSLNDGWPSADEETTTDDFIRKGVGDHQSPDALLAYELNQLSFKERDMINEEIHGVGILDLYPEESPQLLKDSLEKLSIELDSIQQKPAYEISQTFPNTYVNTDGFRLIFLRCEVFDAKKAAARIVGYLDLIHSCFDEKVLERDICCDDFDEKATTFLREGYYQILPGRDRSGRRIWGHFAYDFDPDQPVINRIRASIFIFMRIVKDDVDAQRQGVVAVFWTHNLRIDDLKTRSYLHKKVAPLVPVRFCALHCCLPDMNHHIASLASKMYTLAIGRQLRKRLRVHKGSAVECLYMLQTFGIQPIEMPIYTNTGNIKPQNHHKWLDLQRTKDDAIKKSKPFFGIECPNHKDILFGRGWPKTKHPGNAVFRNLIEARLNEYNNALSKGEKTMITLSIVLELKESEARFLREDKSGWWMEVSNDIARQKVSIGFRDIRKAKIKSSELRSAAAAAASGGNNNSKNSSLTSSALSPSKTSGAVAAAGTSIKRKCDETVPFMSQKFDNVVNNTASSVSVLFLNLDGGKRQRCQPSNTDSSCCF